MLRADAVVCAPRRAPRDVVAREPGLRAPTRASVERSAKPARAIRDPRGGSARAAWVREARDPDRVPRSVRLVHRGGRAELVLRPEGGGEAPPLGVRVRRVDVKMSCHQLQGTTKESPRRLDASRNRRAHVPQPLDHVVQRRARVLPENPEREPGVLLARRLERRAQRRERSVVRRRPAPGRTRGRDRRRRRERSRRRRKTEPLRAAATVAPRRLAAARARFSASMDRARDTRRRGDAGCVALDGGARPGPPEPPRPRRGGHGFGPPPRAARRTARAPSPSPPTACSAR